MPDGLDQAGDLVLACQHQCPGTAEVSRLRVGVRPLINRVEVAEKESADRWMNFLPRLRQRLVQERRIADSLPEAVDFPVSISEALLEVRVVVVAVIDVKHCEESIR